MGLDMYLYVVRAKDDNEWGRLNQDQRIDIGYWRKHYSLHDYMNDLWKERTGRPQDAMFNCIPLELSEEDIKNVMKLIRENKIQYDWEDMRKEVKQRDLRTFKEALKFSKAGCKVFYDSWW